MSAPGEEHSQPAWRRQTRGEHRFPVTVAVVVAIGLQLALPDRMVPASRYLLPALELVVLIGLVVANPFRLDRQSTVLRVGGLVLTGLVGLSNGWSAVLLVLDLVRGRPSGPVALLSAGATIWLTNMLSFALVFWELDRGGPAARAAGLRDAPDFLFAQMQSPEMAPPDWEPVYLDYLYLAFTNATAFSPTDVLPLSRWAKLAMMVQSAVSLIVVVLVVARAINVLG
ncbi:MAG TPA: hypothetical protein VGM60_21220 [Pseudonocardia sp.]|uniref:hypothetical protein n=1 Tax=Pseudonocardia sp. TaxID=60912 RepID=UPI002F3EEEA6